MKLEQQVCSLELAKRLKELGVKQESLYYWASRDEGDWELWPDFRALDERRQNDPTYQFVSAFTVAELEDLLPNRIRYEAGKFAHLRMAKVHTLYEAADGYIPYPLQRDDSIPDARALMLIYLSENQLI